MTNVRKENRYDRRDRWGRFYGPLANDRPSAQDAAAVNRAAAASRVTAARREREAQRALATAQRHPGSAQVQEAARRAQEVSQAAAQDVKNRERQAAMVQQRTALLAELPKRVTSDRERNRQAVDEAFLAAEDARAALRGAKPGDDLDVLRDGVLQAEWVHGQLTKLVEERAATGGGQERGRAGFVSGELLEQAASISVTGTGVKVSANQGTTAEAVKRQIEESIPGAQVTVLSDRDVKVRLRGVPPATLATRLRAVRMPETMDEAVRRAQEEAAAAAAAGLDGSASIRAMDTRAMLFKAMTVLAESDYGKQGARAAGVVKAHLRRANAIRKADGRNEIGEGASLLMRNLGAFEVVAQTGEREALEIAKRALPDVPEPLRKELSEQVAKELAALSKAVPGKDASPEDKRVAQAERAKRYGIEVLDGGSLSYPAGNPTSENGYADPVNLAYPVDTKARAANARVRFKQFADGYKQEASKRVIHERIVRAELRFGIEPSYDANDSLDALLPSDLKERLAKVEKASGEADALGGEDEARATLYGLIEMVQGNEECDNGTEAIEAALSSFPANDGPQRAVLQLHYSPPRSSAHLDLRIQLSEAEAIGYTLIPKGFMSSDLPTIKAAREAVDENVDYDAEDGRPLPLIGDGAFLAIPKGAHDAEWIDKPDGEIAAGKAGGFGNRGGALVRVRTLKAEYGMQTPDFHEYFLEDGEELGVFGGRFVVRKVDGGQTSSGQELFWLARMAEDLTPYVVSADAVKEGAMPPAGKSALPVAVEEMVPPEMRYWTMDGNAAKAARDNLVASGLLADGAVVVEEGRFAVRAAKARKVAKFYGDGNNEVMLVCRTLEVQTMWSEKVDTPSGEREIGEWAVKVGLPLKTWPGKAEDFRETVKSNVVLDGESADDLFVPLGMIEDCKVHGQGELVLVRGDAIAIDKGDDGRYSVDVLGARLSYGRMIGVKVASLKDVIEAATVKFGKSATFSVVKADDDQHLVTGLVLEPNDGENGAPLAPDTQGDIYSQQVIEQAAHDWMASSRAFKLVHADAVQDGEVSVVESWIAPADMKVGSRDIRKGSWLVTAKVTGSLWDKIKAGKLNAFSVGGLALATDA